MKLPRDVSGRHLVGVLETTQIYAQVSIRMLKEVHIHAHPARLGANTELMAELAEEDAELAA